MERQDFEDSWKKAFEGAEAPPSDTVWTNIALDLERANGARLKKRLAFFQLLAAASVVFSLGVGAGIFIMKKSYENAVQPSTLANATVQTPIAEPPVAESLSSESNKQALTDKGNGSANIAQSGTSSLSSTADGESDINSKIVPRSANNPGGNNGFALSVEANNAFVTDRERLVAAAEKRPLPSLLPRQEIKLNLPDRQKQEVDPVQLMLAKLAARESEISKAESSEKRARESEKLWTSVGFAAGSFNATNAGLSNQPSTSTALARNSTIVNKEAKAPGTSYSIGANVGTRLTERWVLQGGVNYLTQSSDYTAQTAVRASDGLLTSFRPASINELDRISAKDLPEENLVSTPPYNVNNSLRYLSIPMQAGYMVINRDFGLQLNAGVSTDVFLQNTVSAEGGTLDKTSQSLGENSPYRSVNLSGLAGTELSYRFSRNYRIALNPGVRYPFNSIYRSELAVKSTPVTFDIGLRFRYIFR